MKKLWTGFALVMILPATAAAAGVVLAPAGLILGIILFLAGAAAAGWWYMYFRELEYADEGGEILIRGGVLFKKSKRLNKGSILWTNCVRLFGRPIISVLHTGGGSVTVFAEFELSDPDGQAHRCPILPQ